MDLWELAARPGPITREELRLYTSIEDINVEDNAPVYRLEVRRKFKEMQQVNEKINVVEEWAKGILQDAQEAQKNLSSSDSYSKLKAIAKVGEIIGACEAIISSMKAAKNP